MNKIKRVSLFFRVLFQVLLVTLPILLVIAWLAFSGTLALSDTIHVSYIPTAYADNMLHPLSSSEKWFALGLASFPLMVKLYILFSLINLFKLYEKGEIFSIKNVRYIHNIGYALIVTQLIEPIYQSVMGFILTRNNPPGHRFVSISLDETNISVILIALMVILISWIMAEGCQLREEQQLTI